MNGKTAPAVLIVVAAALGSGAFWNATTASHEAFVPAPAEFVDVAAESGLAFTCTHWDKSIGLGPRRFTDILFCASPALGDYNGDGFVDAYFANQMYNDPTLNAERNPQDALFINNGDGTFTDASRFVGINDRGYSMGAAALDHDDDGDLDVYVTNYPEFPVGLFGLSSPATVFYVNNGDGTFTLADRVAMGLVTEPRFLEDDRQFGMAVGVADYDRDGDVDLYRGNYIKYRLVPDGMPSDLSFTQPDTNNLYRNDGDGTFTDVTLLTAASRHNGRTFAVNFADFDNDLWPDVYVANDENPNEMYLNRPNEFGVRVFEDFGAGSGADDPRGAMCSEAVDFNNDGNLDIFMSHYEDELDGYYLGHGDGTFTEQSTLGDLEIGKNFLGWGCVGLDYDNDGDRDLYSVNGHMLPTGGEFFHAGDPLDDNGYELPNFLFRNTLRDTGTHSWADVSQSSGPGLRDRLVTGGAMAADFDLDGKLELIAVNNNNALTSLYRNLAPSTAHWLEVELRGTTSNSHGIGSKVVVGAGSLVQTAQMTTGNSLGSGSAIPLHFGLGGAGGPVTVTVTWPTGVVQTETVAVDRIVRIVEGDGVELDTLAPGFDVSLAGTPGAGGWWTSAQVVATVAASDRGLAAQSGLATTGFSLDGSAQAPIPGPITVAGEGVHRLTLFATDLAGNSAWYPVTVKIDSVAPAGPLLQPVAGHLYVQDRDQGPTQSGDTVIVAPVKTPNEEAAEVDAKYRGTRQEIRDKTGNDLGAAPATASGTLASTVGSDGRTTVQAGAADATSGVDRVEFVLDGSIMRTAALAPYAWHSDVRGLQLGEHCVHVVTYDRAGLSSMVPLRVVIVPTTQDGILNTLTAAPTGGGPC